MSHCTVATYPVAWNDPPVHLQQTKLLYFSILRYYSRPYLVYHVELQKALAMLHVDLVGALPMLP